jgi:protein-S-isoprenylcysteine O-methyltransferase Ste14
LTGLAWVIFLIYWIIFHTVNFQLLQNLAVFLLSGFVLIGLITLIVAPMGGLVWFIGLFFTSLDFVIYQNFIFSNIILTFSGITLFIIGGIIRYLSRKTLGKFFTRNLNISKNHQLIINGIYNYIRHPAYLGSMLCSFAIPLIFTSFWGFLATFIFIPYILKRISFEEGLLLEKFGDKYREYQKKVKKLIPYIY